MDLIQNIFRIHMFSFIFQKLENEAFNFHKEMDEYDQRSLENDYILLKSRTQS